MRFMIVCLAGTLAGAALAGAPAQAREAPQAAEAPSARQLALTRQYIELTMTDQLEDAVQQMVVNQMMMDPNTRDMPEEDRQFIIDLTAELTTDMIPQMFEAMIPVYANAFTETELEALIAFYDTDLGRGIIAKTLTTLPEATQATMTVIPRMLDKMAARICQHYGCEPGELETLQREMRGEVAPAARTK